MPVCNSRWRARRKLFPSFWMLSLGVFWSDHPRHGRGLTVAQEPRTLGRSLHGYHTQIHGPCVSATEACIIRTQSPLPFVHQYSSSLSFKNSVLFSLRLWILGKVGSINKKRWGNRLSLALSAFSMPWSCWASWPMGLYKERPLTYLFHFMLFFLVHFSRQHDLKNMTVFFNWSDCSYVLTCT